MEVFPIAHSYKRGVWGRQKFFDLLQVISRLLARKGNLPFGDHVGKRCPEDRRTNSGAGGSWMLQNLMIAMVLELRDEKLEGKKPV